MAIALPVMMARPRPRFRGPAGIGGDAGAVGRADLGGAGLAGGGRVAGGAGFGRRVSAIVPWNCAFSRPACPFFWSPGASFPLAVSGSRLALSCSGLAFSSSG